MKVARAVGVECTVKSVFKRCRVCSIHDLIRKDVPQVDDSFREEVLPEVGAKTSSLAEHRYHIFIHAI